MQIRGKTISFATHKKKQENDQEDKFLNELDKLEKENSINHALLENERKTLYELRQKKMEGVKIRSGAKWISVGEKVTKYFCNLENRNFESKSMNCLLMNNGNITKDQNLILTEAKSFFLVIKDFMNKKEYYKCRH